MYYIVLCKCTRDRDKTRSGRPRAAHPDALYDLSVPTNEVSRRLSASRLAPYVAIGGSTEKALEHYQWNATISATLFEIVGHTEIILRNAIDEQLTDLRRKRGDASGEWFWTNQPWFRPWWTTPMIKLIDQARTRAITTGPVHPGKVVAELSFGFWRYLLTARYEASLWTPTLRHAFPTGLARGTVYDLVEEINIFRNRIAHHEPIHTRNLPLDIQRLEQLLNWISPPTATWALNATRTRLDDLLQNRP